MAAAHAGAACAPGQLRYDPSVENPSVARVLNEIADLLELKGENVFRVRAYRTGAQVVADSPARVADLDVPALLAIDGIGKDLAARIRDIADDRHHRAARRAAAGVPGHDPRGDAPAGHRARRPSRCSTTP